MNEETYEIAGAQEFVQGIQDDQGITAQSNPAKFVDTIRNDIGRATADLEDQREWYRRSDLNDTFDRIVRDEASLKLGHIDYKKFMKSEISTKAHYLADFHAVAQNKREAASQEDDSDDDEVIKELDHEAYKQEKQAHIVKGLSTTYVMREFQGQNGDVEDNFSVSYYSLDGDTLHHYMDELSEALMSYQFSLE